MAGSLPLELQQHVLSYLDPRSFYASRNVCRWWRHASRNSVTLAHHLGQLPIEPPVSAKTQRLESLEAIYDDAAQALMLGMSIKPATRNVKSSLSELVEPKVTISGDGTRAVTLDERHITVYNLNSPEPQVVSRRTINDLRTALGGGPWFKCAPSSVHELALSSDGKTLAIALDRTIQIYDLEAGENSWPVSSYVSSASGHYIAGLQFQHNDSLLRVQLSNKGAVVYLGTPSNEVEGLEHWQGKSGLKHAFLDSTILSRYLKPSSSHGSSQVLAGLQLLQPCSNGWLFAAQLRCLTSNSACYCVGYVAISEMDGCSMAAEKVAYILTELASSSNSTPLPGIVGSIWQDLPSAYIQHPHFSLSADSSILALAENVPVLPHSEQLSRIFVFRLPDAQLMRSRLERISSAGARHELDNGRGTVTAMHSIQRLPLSVGSVSGKILEFGFDTTNEPSCRKHYNISAVTERGLQTWSLLDS